MPAMTAPRRKANTTGARGYGWRHQQLREHWAPKVRAGLVDCARCARPILPGSAWDLGHTDDRTAYRGPEHAHCNRSAGGRNGAAATNGTPVPPKTSRRW